MHYYQKIGKLRGKNPYEVSIAVRTNSYLIHEKTNKQHPRHPMAFSIINLLLAGLVILLGFVTYGQTKPSSSGIFNPASSQVSLGEGKSMSLSKCIPSVPTNKHSFLIRLMNSHWAGCTMRQINIHRTDHHIPLIMKASFAVETFLANTLDKNILPFKTHATYINCPQTSLSVIL